jgi:hypothetical protein
MHSVSCLIPASNTQHVEFGRVKERRRRNQKKCGHFFYPASIAQVQEVDQFSVFPSVDKSV